MSGIIFGGLTRLKGRTLQSVSRGTWDGSTRQDGSHIYGGVHCQNVETITFHCEDGDYVFLADGDCCSQTYIDSVEGPTAGRIMSIDQPAWAPDGVDDNDPCAETQYYKVTLAIEGKGHLDVTYRNESNGYYGGSLEALSWPVPA